MKRSNANHYKLFQLVRFERESTYVYDNWISNYDYPIHLKSKGG